MNLRETKSQRFVSCGPHRASVLFFLESKKRGKQPLCFGVVGGGGVCACARRARWSPHESATMPKLGREPFKPLEHTELRYVPMHTPAHPHTDEIALVATTPSYNVCLVEFTLAGWCSHATHNYQHLACPLVGNSDDEMGWHCAATGEFFTDYTYATSSPSLACMRCPPLCGGARPPCTTPLSLPLWHPQPPMCRLSSHL